MEEQHKENHEEQPEHKDEKKVSKKERRRQEARKKAKIRTIKNWTIGLVVVTVLVGGVYLLAQIGGPEGEDHSERIPVMSDTSHIPVGQSETVQYNSNPPTSGPHYGPTAMFGFRDEQISDGHIIHNLEHGDVWISYHPDIPEEIKDDLRDWFHHLETAVRPRNKKIGGVHTAFAMEENQEGETFAGHLPGQRGQERRSPRINHQKIIITPREENDTDIALAAWGRLDAFDLDEVGGVLPIQRIEDFIIRYMGRGPERIPGASGGV